MSVRLATLDDGCRIAWRLDGPEDAPVLMLANSLGTTMDMWQPQLDAFTRHWRVLRYDSRGHGRSDVPPGSYGIDRLGRDAVTLLNALEIERVHFCGLSLGGMIGQWLGVRAGTRIDRLILANTAPYMGPPASWNARIAAVKSQGMAAVADAVVDRWFTPEFLLVSPDRKERALAMLLATDPIGYAGCCAAIRDMDLRPMIAQITAPTLVILGTRDRATPQGDGAAIAAAISGARTIALPCAHLSNLQQPAEFTAAVLDFLS